MKKISYILGILLLTAIGAVNTHAENRLTAVVTPIDTDHYTIDLNLENTDAFISFQADLILPEGFQLTEKSLQASSRLSGFAVEATMLSGNRLRVVGYSENISQIAAGTGAIVSLKIENNTDIVITSPTITLRNLLFTKANYEEITLMGSIVDLNPGEVVEGDLNRDGKLTIADVSLLVQKVLEGETNSFYDINKDSRVSVSDITALVNMLLQQ